MGFENLTKIPKKHLYEKQGNTKVAARKAIQNIPFLRK
jgi:hypothetical protein